jgi:hypothetical protein
VKKLIIFFISGLKKANDGDFKIKYTVSRFGAINDRLCANYYQVSAYYIGIGLTWIIWIKQARLFTKIYNIKLACLAAVNLL